MVVGLEETLAHEVVRQVQESTFNYFTVMGRALRWMALGCFDL
jgi:hypothetical protein